MNRSKLETCFDNLAADSAEALALATVIQVQSPTSSKPGDKALIGDKGIIEGWIGGGCVQAAIVNASKTAIETQQAIFIRVAPKGEWQAIDGLQDFSSGCLSGGSVLIFIEAISKKPQLSVLGHSPIALSLTCLAPQMGFQVSVVSPDIDQAQLPEDVLHLPDFCSINSEYCVIATLGKRDKVALKAALNSSASYIAMIASSKKANALKQALLDEGIEKEQVNRISSPAGLNINAVTPAEIALSVLAELVKVRRQKIDSFKMQNSDSPSDQNRSSND